MKKRKTMPAHEPFHDEIYETLLVNYGYNTQLKMEKVNREWLNYFHVENNTKNRDTLRKRMEHLHPNKAACSPEKRTEIEARRAERAEFFSAEQDDDRRSDRERLEAILEVVQNSILDGNAERFTVRDFTDLLKQKMKLNEQEAKIHGLYTNRPSDNEPTNNFENKLSDAEGLLEKTLGTENSNPREDQDGTHD